MGMTSREAIDTIRTAIAQVEWDYPMNYATAFDMAIKALEKQEAYHRLQVHNIGNVDIPDGVTKEQFSAVMNNVVDALEHTDKGESWPYDEAASDMRDYCERYEPTYNPEDGSM